MNFGRISTSKYRSKLQKMGVLYTHSPKSPGPFPKLPKIHLKKKIKKSKKLEQLDKRRCQPAVVRRSRVGLFPFF
jgi:hypothetical protein